MMGLLSSLSSLPLLLLLLLMLLLEDEVQGAEAGTTTAVQLTVHNFEDLVTGRSVFLKFYAPWCAHCRAMSDDWDTLANDFANHPVTLIGKVDCTADEGQPICDDFDVQGFPTLIFGDPMSAETYDGPRDYAALKAFADEHLTKPICSLFQIDNCPPEKKAMIEALEAKTDVELEDIVAQVEMKVKDKEVIFDEKVSAIQKEYDALVAEFNQHLDQIKKEFHYKYVEQILSVRHEEAEQQQAAAATTEGDEL